MVGTCLVKFWALLFVTCIDAIEMSLFRTYLVITISEMDFIYNQYITMTI